MNEKTLSALVFHRSDVYPVITSSPLPPLDDVARHLDYMVEKDVQDDPVIVKAPTECVWICIDIDPWLPKFLTEIPTPRDSL